jgi:hypothetical protein
MQSWQMVAIGVAIIVIAAGLAWWTYERNRTKHLRERFGLEYDRRIADLGNRRQVESELLRSEARVQKLKIQPLNASDRARFIEEWRLCQARFVDDPTGAVHDADRIVTDIMRTRGYAVDNPVDRVTDVCAAYPNQASAYREANEIVNRQERNDASTEDLRNAFVNIRSLFDEMLESHDELKRAS